MAKALLDLMWLTLFATSVFTRVGFALSSSIFANGQTCYDIGDKKDIYDFQANCHLYVTGSGNEYRYVLRHTFASCAALCASEDQCTNFDVMDTNGNACRLYGSLRNLVTSYSEYYSSGLAKQPKVYSDTCNAIGDGKDIYGFTAKCGVYVTGAGNQYRYVLGHTFASCAALCASDDQCTNFDVSNTDGNPCRLYASLGSLTYSPSTYYSSGLATQPKVQGDTCSAVGDGKDIWGFTAKCGAYISGAGNGYSAVKEQTFASCAALCASEDQCTNFDFAEQTDKTCKLYASDKDVTIGSSTYYSAGVAKHQKPGYKTCADVGNGTSTIGLIALCGYSLDGVPYQSDAADTYPICASRCQAEAECINFSYRTTTKQCLRYPAGQRGLSRADPDWDSGVAPGQKPKYTTCLDFGSGSKISIFTAHCGFALRAQSYISTVLPTFPICAEACQTDVYCHNFHYHRETGTCRRYYPGQGAAYQADAAYDAGIGLAQKTPYKTCEDFKSGTVVAGFTAWCGVNFKGTEYKTSSAAGFPVCAEMCRDDGQCVNFAYQDSTGGCYLYAGSAGTDIEADPDYAVGLGGAPPLPTTTAAVVSTTTASCSCMVTEYI